MNSLVLRKDIPCFTMAITPDINGCVAIPVGYEKYNDKKYSNNDTMNIIYLISIDLEKEPGVYVKNAMFHSFSFTLEIELQGKETIKQAEKRVYKAFEKVWKRFVEKVEPGKSLEDSSADRINKSILAKKGKNV